MNKSAILFFIASTFAMVSFSEANMMGNYKIALVDQHFQWVNEQGAVVTLKELEEKLEIPADLNLPTTQEEMDKFYEIYSKTSPTQLGYCTNFYQIAKQSALKLVFACTSFENLDAWIKNAHKFLNLIKEKEDPFFKSDIENNYIKLWLKTLNEISFPCYLSIDIEKIKNSLNID